LKKYIFACSCCCSLLFGYEPGEGIELANSLKVGGYITAKYESGKDTSVGMLDDIAFIAYGNIGSHTRYLFEMENVGRYSHNFSNGKVSQTGAFRPERAVIDHSFSSHLNLSIGKMITPVGYWNQTPINVLRDTTSSPLVATNIFPKLITGAQLYGDAPHVEDVEYTVAAQSSRDLDEKYNNFMIDRFFGLGAKYTINDDHEIKAYAGSFRERVTLIKRNFTHLAYKFEKNEWQILSEAAYSTIDASNSKNTTAGGGFVQSRYKINSKNYAIARYEYYFDAHENEKQHLAVVGYNYRPIYPVSFKAEYQLSSTPDRSRFLCSISALF